MVHFILYYCFIVLGALYTNHVLGAKERVSVQFSSVTQSCPTLCNPMDCCIPDFPVHHQLLKLAQTHVHWVCDAIWPSHSLSSPSPPAFNLSRHQGLFQWVSSSHQVAKVLTKDLIECLENYGQRFVTLYRRQWSRPSPRKRKSELISVFLKMCSQAVRLCFHV